MGRAIGMHGGDPGICRSNVELEVEVLAWTTYTDPTNKLCSPCCRMLDRALGINTLFIHDFIRAFIQGLLNVKERFGDSGMSMVLEGSLTAISEGLYSSGKRAASIR